MPRKAMSQTKSNTRGTNQQCSVSEQEERKSETNIEDEQLLSTIILYYLPLLQTKSTLSRSVMVRLSAGEASNTEVRFWLVLPGNMFSLHSYHHQHLLV